MRRVSITFSTHMDWVLGKLVDQCHRGAASWNIKVSGPDFADDAIIFAESLDVLARALDVLHEVKPLS